MGQQYDGQNNTMGNSTHGLSTQWAKYSMCSPPHGQNTQCAVHLMGKICNGQFTLRAIHAMGNLPHGQLDPNGQFTQWAMRLDPQLFRHQL